MFKPLVALISCLLLVLGLLPGWVASAPQGPEGNPNDPYTGDYRRANPVDDSTYENRFVVVHHKVPYPRRPKTIQYKNRNKSTTQGKYGQGSGRGRCSASGSSSPTGASGNLGRRGVEEDVIVDHPDTGDSNNTMTAHGIVAAEGDTRNLLDFTSNNIIFKNWNKQASTLSVTCDPAIISDAALLANCYKELNRVTVGKVFTLSESATGSNDLVVIRKAVVKGCKNPDLRACQVVKTYDLTYDYDFTSAAAPNKISMEIEFSTLQDMTAIQAVTSAPAHLRKRSWNSFKDFVKKVDDGVHKLTDGVQKLNTVESNQSGKFRMTHDFNQPLLNIASAPCRCAGGVDVGAGLNLGVEGSVEIEGVVGASVKGTLVPPNVESAYAFIKGQPSASLTLKMDAAVFLKKEFARINIVSIPLTPYQLPGIGSIGPQFDLDLRAVMDVRVKGQMKAKMEMELPEVGVTVGTGNRPENTVASPSPDDIDKPDVTASFDSSVTMQGSVEFHLIPKASIGINLFKNLLDARVGIETDARLVNALSISASEKGNLTTGEVTNKVDNPCLRVSAGAEVNVVAEGKVFWVVDSGDKLNLYRSPELELFKKCFGPNPPPSPVATPSIPPIDAKPIESASTATTTSTIQPPPIEVVPVDSASPATTATTPAPIEVLPPSDASTSTTTTTLTESPAGAVSPTDVASTSTSTSTAATSTYLPLPVPTPAAAKYAIYTPRAPPLKRGLSHRDLNRRALLDGKTALFSFDGNACPCAAPA
ncbi:hypothetical protein HK104_011145 [Borealophlyctis nickersoniae]|nr:hypothetical protein HK104_011145 [Borealophlyctis nickersoniae]